MVVEQDNSVQLNLDYHKSSIYLYQSGFDHFIHAD